MSQQEAVSGRVRLDIRKRFFTQSVVRHWNREVVTAPSLPEFKKSLDKAVRHMMWFSGCPVQGQELDSMIFVGPFQLRIFCDSTVSCFRRGKPLHTFKIIVSAELTIFL